MSVEIIYETHAISTDNEAGIATGWLPGELSAEGRRLARELGERRRDDRLAAVFVSDLWRAVETAEIAFAGSAIPIYHEPRLRECNYGELNGVPAEQVAAERRRRIDEPFPGGQSYRQVVEATVSFLRDLEAGWHDQRVLLISHSANRWALDHLLNGIPLEELVDAPFAWQEGWEYVLPDLWSMTHQPLTMSNG
jgi:alpha-ribazole phosphatase/probable phosphoglycerate mutase